MKTTLQNLLRVLPLAISLALTVACGKKNRVNTSSLPTTGTTVMGMPNIPAAQATQIQQIIAQSPCSTGARLPELQFSSQGAMNNGNTSLVSGPFNQGFIGGPVSATFLGMSNFKDVMIVTKIANGTQVLGYNITISFCQFSPLLIPGRPLSGFSAPMGIVLDQDTNCGIGSVDYAEVIMIAGQYQMYPQAQVATTFTKSAACGSFGGYTGGYTGGYNGGYNGGWWWP